MTVKIFEQGLPIEQAKKALILLHGRADRYMSILSLGDLLTDSSYYIAAPQTPEVSWYPHSFLAEETSNEPWLSAWIRRVTETMEKISAYIPKENIFIVGFYQGACLALEVTARNAQKYGGVAAFTGGLIGKELNPKKYRGDFHQTPFFIGNSDQDPHVPLKRSEQSKEIIQSLGGIVTLKVYPNMPHTIIEEEIQWVTQNIMS